MRKMAVTTLLVVSLLSTSAVAANLNPAPAAVRHELTCAQVQALANALIAYISASRFIPENLKPVLIKAVEDAAAKTPCTA